MELRLPTTKDFLKIWKQNFFGQTGFFIPGDRVFTLSQEMTIVININDEIWGNARVLPAWSNLHGPVTRELPRGTFLKIIRADKVLQQKINNLGI